MKLKDFPCFVYLCTVCHDICENKIIVLYVIVYAQSSTVAHEKFQY